MAELAKLRGARNVYIRHLENLEVKIKELIQHKNPINDDIVANLRGAKNSFIDKIKELKVIDEKILDLLSEKPADFEKELEKNLQRDDSYFQIRALADQFLEKLVLKNVPTSVGSSAQTTLNVSQENNTNLPKFSIRKFDGNVMNWQTFWDQYDSAVHSKRNISDIDKFTFLTSLLSESAFETISGLNLTSNNYKEAIELLKNRYGNPQVLINAYMEKFVQLEVVTKMSDVIRLRKLYNQVETGIRNLKTLDVKPESYGSLLIPVLNSKLPGELRTIFARKFDKGVWELTEMMKLFRNELEAKERAFSANPHNFRDKNQSNFSSAALFNSDNKNSCVYCGGSHPSSKCRKVSNPKSRKDILFKNKACFICFSTNHFSSQCTSKYRCKKCEGRHHISICMKDDFVDSNRLTTPAAPVAGDNNDRQTVTNFNNSRNNILLQTAHSNVSDVDSNYLRKSYILFDNGAQRSYITESLKEQLHLNVIRSERVAIKVFGKSEAVIKDINVVRVKVLGLREDIFMEALVIPEICNSLTNQNSKMVINTNYPHLRGLRFADFSNIETKKIDLLVGMDFHYSFITGNIKKGNEGEPIAIESKLGWLLCGYFYDPSTNVNLNQTHFFLAPSRNVIENNVKNLWEFESVGIDKQSCDVYKNFENELNFNGDRYSTKLPFKPHEEVIPDNFKVAKNRLNSLKRKLDKDRDLCEKYSNIIDEYKKEGIIEQVTDSGDVGNVHYLPHQPVLRTERDTTKLRIVFDASSKASNEQSLNELLYSGPCLLPMLYDILLRFRLGKYAMISDIKQAFLQIELDVLHRNFTRFLWFDDIYSEDINIVIYRFTRILFGLTCSPFILNGTLKYHFKKFLQEHCFPKVFIEKLLRDLYVDDLLNSFNEVQTGHEFYKVANEILLKGGFRLCKWASNCIELQTIFNNDNNVSPNPSCIRKVLGIYWNITDDKFLFDFKHIIEVASDLECTKRNVLRVMAMFYDPIGLICPIVLQLKLLYKKICMEKIDWDSLLSRDIHLLWLSILKNLKKLNEIHIDRHVFSKQTDYSEIILHGFCDASKEAYSALVYLQIISRNGTFTNLLTAKSKIVPSKNLSIPRIELLSCVLLTKLITSVKDSVKFEIDISRVICWCDAQVVLWWLKQKNKVWKVWVENRVRLIRENVGIDCWRYVSSSENPADLATRGSSSFQNLCSEKWYHGPKFLMLPEKEWPITTLNSTCENVVFEEERMDSSVLLNSVSLGEGIGNIMNVETFSCLKKLLRVTAYVLRFVGNLKNCLEGKSKVEGELIVDEIDAAERKWLLYEQSFIINDSSFEKRRASLNLFFDDFNLLHSKTRIDIVGKNEPLLLRNNSYFTKLVIEFMHRDVNHSGLTNTLSRLRTKYWLIKGRNNVKRVISKCLICKFIHGKPVLPPSSPSLPKYRVCCEYPFENVGVDYAGPLFVKDIYSSSKDMNKCYILIFTCATTRCVHLELVSSFTTDALLLCLRRFIARRGKPNLFISDNFKTFKAKEIKEFLLNARIKWEFILEKSPWWGGFYERLISIVKNCLKKIMGKSFLNYEEMNTILIDVEETLNLRPLTYLEEENYEESLTPFHLLYGRNIKNSRTSQPFKDISDPKLLRQRYKVLKTVIEHFTKRFYDEYIVALHERHCYDRTKTENSCKLKIGEVVLIKEERVPRIKWRKGRILKFIHGKDKMIRGVELKTYSNNNKITNLKRPLQLIVPFEMQEEIEPAKRLSDNVIIEDTNAYKDETIKRDRPKRIAALNADLLRRINDED